MDAISLSDIDFALRSYKSMAERETLNCRAREHDFWRDHADRAERGLRVLRELERNWADIKRADQRNKDDYDRYVTTERCCSCHLSAPCSHCIESSQPEAAAP